MKNSMSGAGKLVMEDPPGIPETRVSGFGTGSSALEKWLFGKSFLQFLPIFYHVYLIVFQNETHRRCCKTLKNHQICHEFGKK